MKQRVYAVYDKRAEEAGPLFQAKNDSVGLRNFENMLDREGVKAEEYKLLYLGIYDNEKVMIFANSDPEEVILKLSSEVE